MSLSSAQIQQFRQHGFLIRPQMVSPATVAAMRAETERQLATGTGPVEYEADMDYPGSPTDREAEGGRTVRRLLQAEQRGPLFADWFGNAEVVADMTSLLGGTIKQARAHHNCVMTKQPRYSSDTGWHQDIRYWNFHRPDLISVWLALGPEYPENGGLKVIPGSHTLEFSAQQLDERKFFRSDLAENQEIIATAIDVKLEPGDVLYFHARLLHAASRNHTQQTKYAVVASYRPLDNLPIAGTRSAQQD
ncbi:phytanoyl-CoA dioxygenase family protein [Permianibacter sp. IMCC34836]|uniref:phytanoyl-CoA dioxygenase family protein n=1 Tax=Permianibacter fluminis TaxID=2738515 RepID=UPI00155336A6|nr:phytanoyl-CoA dioxygenase family protein [Permianibacter fluminis]NQD37316.1 phytanoyl-CoA dioxygenase family protein [Permianibacter fluminis]